MACLPFVSVKWANSDEKARNLSVLPGLALPSETMQDDKSQPPTPDGTGRPVNFQIIAPGLYRSSYPSWAHYRSLADLDLKTVITLVPEPISLDYGNFLSSNGIIHYHLPILANKDPAVCSTVERVHEVLRLMLDPSNYPMMIHCNKGKHRTGCMTACFRKVTGWTDEACIEEYEVYSTPKDRFLDKVFIAKFDPAELKPLALQRGYVGGPYRQPVNGSSEYTVATVDTEDSYDNGYHAKAFADNQAALESTRLWSYK